MKDFADKPVNNAKSPLKRQSQRGKQFNEVVAAMFAMYQSGKSLAEIGRVYRRRKNAIHRLFTRRGYALRHTKSYVQHFDGIAWRRTKGGYLCHVFPDGHYELLHRYIWQKQSGAIPPNHWIFFKNDNREDCRIENLECLSMSEYRARKKVRCQARRTVREIVKAERQARWAKLMEI